MRTKKQIFDEIEIISKTVAPTSYINTLCNEVKTLVNRCYDKSGEKIEYIATFIFKILGIYQNNLTNRLGMRAHEEFLNALEDIISSNLENFFAGAQKETIVTFCKVITSMKSLFSARLIDQFSLEIHRLVKELETREITENEIALIYCFFKTCLKGNQCDFLSDTMYFAPTPTIKAICKDLTTLAGANQKIRDLCKTVSTLYDDHNQKLKNQSILPKFLSSQLVGEKKPCYATSVLLTKKTMDAAYSYLITILPKDVAFLAAAAYISDFLEDTNITRPMTRNGFIAIWEAKQPSKPSDSSFARIKQEITELTRTSEFNHLISTGFKQECKQRVENFKTFKEIQKWLKNAKTDICTSNSEKMGQPQAKAVFDKLCELEWRVRQTQTPQLPPLQAIGVKLTPAGS